MTNEPDGFNKSPCPNSSNERYHHCRRFEYYTAADTSHSNESADSDPSDGSRKSAIPNLLSSISVRMSTNTEACNFSKSTPLIDAFSHLKLYPNIAFDSKATLSGLNEGEREEAK
ncbi:unnamed protein product [Protopolystoma xenopodis]|uniref:Uncharacterized protein n=1 Tax=Protopolystoma xenopodis TaxID=117903 RepID=A0A448WUL8_9PLAT|nr:unnamed protein product [Protopolystoma xenopodis]